MIYAQGGGLLKASVTHLSLGLEGFFLCLFIVLICSVVSLPHRLLFPIYHVSYIQYIAMLCIPKPMNVSFWSTVGFFEAHDFQGCLCSARVCVRPSVFLGWVWKEMLGCFCLLILNVKEYVCTEILRSQWLLMFLFSLSFSLLIECDCWHAPRKKNVLNYGASFKQLINCIFVLGCNEFGLVIS